MTHMKLFLLFILLFHSAILFGQTQSELTAESAKRLKTAETELSSVYKKILTAYSDDAEFIKNLKESQEFWIKFKQVELKMMYPNREPGYYGSAHQMCINDYLAQLTNDRTAKLKLWLAGTEDDDICSGSIQVKR